MPLHCRYLHYICPILLTPRSPYQPPNLRHELWDAEGFADRIILESCTISTKNLLLRFKEKQTDMDHGCVRAKTYHPRRLSGSLLLPPRICTDSDYGHVPHNAALPLQSPDCSRASKPIHDRHFNVHQYDGQWDTLGCTTPKRGCLDDVERFDSMVGDVDGAAQGVQLLAEDLLVDEVVLYDEDREL